MGCGWRDAGFGGAGRRNLFANQEAVQPHAALRDFRELLGHALASGSVLVSFRTYDDGLFGCRAAELVLSGGRARTAVLRFQHRSVSHSAGTALPERCAGG